jgi:exonuclease 1
MELNTISALRKLGIEVIVSPYEADAQLAHLCQIGYCDSVLTEDSDILVYSAICGMPFNVFYKFDRAGSVQVINLGEIQLIGPNSNSDSSTPDASACDFDAVSTKSGKQGKDKEKDKEAKGFLAALKHLKGPSGRRMFAQICILAGCDYSESVFGVGLIAAQRVRHSFPKHLE